MGGTDTVPSALAESPVESAIRLLRRCADRLARTDEPHWSDTPEDLIRNARRAADNLLTAHAAAVAEAEARGRAEALAAVDAACEAASGPAGVLDLIRTDDGWNAAGFATDAYGTAASDAILAAALAPDATPESEAQS